ncbi:hypothetical protein ETB97_006987 [Aspergillus alliaceus]|uniref:Uncharacterized protein n=1 Tax=Petromyces alliaceus TaxID=209559 RepID=A0A5N6G1G8_PETAA|nr:cytochrome P450 [Aspergillus alliaceus]KAB8236161.1 cytochrome P450 [Aspergillus alliaceus]KAF5856704.1 hypothetical protein ETB97_006987 [Aspergillus burnettii]
MGFLTALANTDGEYLLFGGAVTLVVVFTTLMYPSVVDELCYRQFPLVGKHPWELFNGPARARWAKSAEDLIIYGCQQGYKVFQVMTGITAFLILDPCFADEVKNHPDLSFVENVKQVFFSDKPGFRGFSVVSHDNLFMDVVQGKLTQATNKQVGALSKKAAEVVETQFPPSDEWIPFYINRMGTPTVAMLAAFTFLGDRISRSGEWLNVVINYTVDAHAAVQVLRFWPSFLRPLALRFHPAPQKPKKHMENARRIIFRELEDRKKDPKYSPESGFEDTLDWFRDASAGREWDVPTIEVGLSLVSTHTTGQLFVNTMMDLAAYPEYQEALREEVIAVLKEDGCLKQSGLAKLKLMDSVIKETQRLNPGEVASMHRVATKNIKLSDGTIIPKGANLMVSSHRRKDPAYYENPEEYDGYRYLRMRQQQGEESRHQLTTTSPENLGFGHGIHACPGRFIAGTLIKIFLSHLLLKYDWKLPEGEKRPPSIPMGPDLLLDKSVQIEMKSRECDAELIKLLVA